MGDKTYKYLVHWNNYTTGGRYYECRLIGDWNPSTEKIDVIASDGGEATVPPSKIFKIGCEVQLNDDVMAYYWDSSITLYRGK